MADEEYNNNEDVDFDPDPLYIDQDTDEEAGRDETPVLADDSVLTDITINLGEGIGEADKIVADDTRQWYVVHCYSGQENKVRHAIEQRIETMGMQDKIFDVVVPTEEEIEVREGKRRTIERRVFPGYILVQMKMDEDSVVCRAQYAGRDWICRDGQRTDAAAPRRSVADYAPHGSRGPED